MEPRRLPRRAPTRALSRRIEIAPRAQAEIVAIWEYTALEYGQDAATAYVTELDAVMLRVLEFPHMGADCSEIRKGYRRIRAGSHMIYYVPHKRGIDAMRVMHHRQHARQLKS